MCQARAHDYGCLRFRPDKNYFRRKKIWNSFLRTEETAHGEHLFFAGKTTRTNGSCSRTTLVKIYISLVSHAKLEHNRIRHSTIPPFKNQKTPSTWMVFQKAKFFQFWDELISSFFEVIWFRLDIIRTWTCYVQSNHANMFVAKNVSVQKSMKLDKD